MSDKEKKQIVYNEEMLKALEEKSRIEEEYRKP